MDALVFDHNYEWETASLSAPQVQEQAVDLPNEAPQTPSTELQLTVSAMQIQICITKHVSPFTLFFLFACSILWRKSCTLFRFLVPTSASLRAVQGTQNKTQEHISSPGSASKIRRNSNLESCASHVIHTVKNKHTKPHLQDYCNSTWTCLQQIMICSCSFWVQLSIIPKCIPAQVPSERLTAGLGTILLPTN